MLLASETPAVLPHIEEICVLAKLSGVVLCKHPAMRFLPFYFVLLSFLLSFL